MVWRNSSSASLFPLYFVWAAADFLAAVADFLVPLDEAFDFLTPVDGGLESLSPL